MKNEKIKFRDRLKDISSGLGESLKESTLWGSIFRPGSPFRKGYSDSPRNRSYVVMNNVLYHLHPVRAIKNGVYESPWDEDSGERSDRHGYIYGRL